MWWSIDAVSVEPVTVRISIQIKSIVGISVLTVGLAFSLMWISLYHGGEAIREELLRRGDISVKNLAYNSTYATLIGDTTALADLLNGVLAEQEVFYARIVERAGRVLVQRGRLAEQQASDERPERTTDSAGGEWADGFVLRFEPDGQTVHFQAPIILRQDAQTDPFGSGGLYDAWWGDDARGGRKVLGHAQIGMTTHYIEDSIARMRSNMMWITILVALCAILVTSIAVRVSIRPVNDLADATHRIAGGDYDVRVADDRKDEIGDLAKSFNRMTADLKATRGALVEKNLLEDAILELKETQQQLVQAGKMAAIGQLAAGVAHEINNPLAGIMGYAQLAAEQLRARSARGIRPEEVARFQGYIENMERQSQRCKHIVQNLLRFARASSKDQTAPIAINDVLRETLQFMEHQLTTRQVTVTLALAENLPSVMGHAGQLQQIFTNILINAVQAMRDNGDLHVTSRLFSGWVQVIVRDNGHGIAPDNLEKIFEPFFTTKEIGQGTGLGLSVTYGLVKDMGGRIDVESQVNAGTTFTVSLPSSGRIANSQPPVKGQAPSPPNEIKIDEIRYV
jgi:signal transduction histidine kinase